MTKRRPVSREAMARHCADIALAERFDELFAQAQAAEQALRGAQANGTPVEELYKAAKRLDSTLTAVMRAAFAAQRAAIGPRGYDDRIYRRKALATPTVRTWTMEAERLLTLRESHRLTGIPRLPHRPQEQVPHPRKRTAVTTEETRIALGVPVTAISEDKKAADKEPTNGENSSVIQGNLPWIIGALSLAFIAVRLLSVTGFDPETAFVVLEAEGTGTVIVGSLVPTVGLLAAPASFVLIYDFYKIKDIRFTNPLSYAKMAVGYSLGVVALLTAPIFILLECVLLTTLIYTLSTRQYKRRQRTQTGSPPAKLGAKEVELRVTAIYAATILLLALITPISWIPASDVSLRNGPSFTGYSLSGASSRSTFLTSNPIEVVEIPSIDISAITECKPSGYWYNEATAGEFFAEWLHASRRVSYPSCPERSHPDRYGALLQH